MPNVNITSINFYLWDGAATSVGPALGQLGGTAGYSSFATFYTGSLSLASLSASVVAPVQLYVQVNTTSANGAELRGNVQNVRGQWTHTAVLTGGQIVPSPVLTLDGGIAFFKVANTVLTWSAVVSDRAIITNGLAIYVRPPLPKPAPELPHLRYPGPCRRRQQRGLDGHSAGPGRHQRAHLRRQRDDERRRGRADAGQLRQLAAVCHRV